MSWWQWVRTSAESTHSIFFSKLLDQRERVFPQETVPPHHAQVESWMRPRILACLPKTQREWVAHRALAGVVDASNTLVYHLFKFFAPGSPREKYSLLRKVLNPNVCTNPQSAQIEFMRWRTGVQRLSALGCMPPDLSMSYRAFESIFGIVFDKAEPQLHMLLIQLKNWLGLPHLVTLEAFKEVSEFADAELSALVLLGRTSLNPGLPLTENQRTRQLQLKENENKRAAKASGALPASVPPPPSQAARLSSPLSSWVQHCTNLQKGECKRGVSCNFHHAGFPTEEKRCLICKSPEHSSKECRYPGGGADPQKEKHWEEYRARRKQAEEAGKTDKGKKGRGKGKGKSTDQGRDKGEKVKNDKATEANAKACVDLERAAAAGNSQGLFTRNCVALDSWANVWLKHKKDKPVSYYQDVLHLAHCQCHCHRETSLKGVPIVYVPWSKSNENIDLFPEGFLSERGCIITRGDDVIVRTPKGREFQIQMWGNMPYIKKDELQLILSDLTEYHLVGRSGRPATVPTAARVAYVHVNLDHLKNDIPLEDLSKIKSKYLNLQIFIGRTTSRRSSHLSVSMGWTSRSCSSPPSPSTLSCGSCTRALVPFLHVRDKNEYRTCFQ